MKERLSYFAVEKNGYWGQPLVSEIFGQTDVARARPSVRGQGHSVKMQSNG